jgi:hypothetical protein
MNRRFEGVSRIETRELFDRVSLYCEELLHEATAIGALAEQGSDNEYTRELGRVICLCADYERDYMYFEHLDGPEPLSYYARLHLPRRRRRSVRRLLRVPSRRGVAVAISTSNKPCVL